MCTGGGMPALQRCLAIAQQQKGLRLHFITPIAVIYEIGVDCLPGKTLNLFTVNVKLKNMAPIHTNIRGASVPYSSF